MAAHVISYREYDRRIVSRLLLESGEKLFIKVELTPICFVGIWRLGSLNPLTIAFDWLMSLRTGVRTTGLQQLWGLGSAALGDREAWLAAVMAIFNPTNEKRTVLASVTSTLQQCRSLAEVEGLIRSREEALTGPFDSVS